MKHGSQVNISGMFLGNKLTICTNISDLCHKFDYKIKSILQLEIDFSKKFIIGILFLTKIKIVFVYLI